MAENFCLYAVNKRLVQIKTAKGVSAKDLYEFNQNILHSNDIRQKLVAKCNCPLFTQVIIITYKIENGYIVRPGFIKIYMSPDEICTFFLYYDGLVCIH